MLVEAFIEMIDQVEVEIAKQEASEEGNAIIGIKGKLSRANYQGKLSKHYL
jgi:hypothetical protein